MVMTIGFGAGAVCAGIVCAAAVKPRAGAAIKIARN
jgi:hypothetical protein